MTSSPEEIRRDIESTRRELSSDVDALTDKVSPKRVVERRVDRTKGALSNAKEKVMGSPSPGNGSRSMGGTVSDTASTVADAASSAPDQARARTRGNPLAAGLIAFGAGWLVSSLLPATEKEQQAATAVKDRAQEHADTVKEPLATAANEMKENLREPAQQAAQSVTSSAKEGADNVRGEAQSAASEVRNQAQDSATRVQDPSSPGAAGSSADLHDSTAGTHRAD